MIEIDMKSTKSNQMELKVRSLLSTCKWYNDTIEGFERMFNEEIKKVKSGNHLRPDATYILRQTDGITRTLIHKNTQSDERIIAVIKEID